MQDENPVAPPHEPVAGPVETVSPTSGRALREAREARGLTVFEVAQSLKFSPRQVEAIEADDFDGLPAGATFIRGFVRSYARLLKLDPAPLLASVDARAPSALPEVRAPQNMGVAASPLMAGRRSSTPMLWGATVLAMLAAALAIWQYFGAPMIPGQAARPTTGNTVREAVSIQPSTAPVDTAPAIQAVDAPVASAAIVTPPASDTPAPVSAADSRQLVFAFQDKSWVEVRDANQRVLLSGENLPGTRQTVAGRPPFQLVIGNAAKVELRYEDRSVDLKPHIRAEVARLTIE